MMQKLLYLFYYVIQYYTISNTPDDSDHGYYIVFDFNYTNSCKNRTEQLALKPKKRKINDNELGNREREKGRARTDKLILDQNNKTEYIVDYRILKFYVKMGVKVINFIELLNLNKITYVETIFKTN